MKIKKTEFEKSLSRTQYALWFGYKLMLKNHKDGYDINTMPQEDREKVETAFLNECIKRGIH